MMCLHTTSGLEFYEEFGGTISPLGLFAWDVCLLELPFTHDPNKFSTGTFSQQCLPQGTPAVPFLRCHSCSVIPAEKF